ncbi:asparagine synthase (glutamine-hydrolyzing) [Fibrobacterota bacterium]
MCGIAGELRFEAAGKAGADWDYISELMRRRGPDDQGRWDDESCTLVFRRLSILDLTPAGHQPMCDDSGRFWLTYNGEVYNFREMRRDLEGRGISFTSSGDSEVVLYALREWGKRALDKFNGIFALAFYDSEGKKLLLARDHAGIKPLYYMLTEQGVMFASQYDQVLAHPGSAGQKVSRRALGMYLRLGYVSAPDAMLENTHMLEPGEWVEVDFRGHVRRDRFYSFPVFQETSLSGEEGYEALDECLSRAVRRQMISDAPLGCFLSGGIDSPLIAAIAQASSTAPLKAFTLGIDNDRRDESGDASLYAGALGVEHHVKNIRLDETFSLIRQALHAGGEPFSDYSIIPTMRISGESSRQVKVMLSGDGGDELFWGYVDRFASTIQRSPDFRRPLWWRKARWGMKKYLNLGDGYYNLAYPDIGAWQLDKHSRLREAWFRQVFPEAPAWPQERTGFEYRGWIREETAQWLRWNEFVTHLTMVLLKVDRASMFHSLEVRVPFLDKEVIDTALKIDWQSCIDLKRNIGKLPLRQALKKRLPVQTLGKRGFEVPMDKWLRTSLAPLLEEFVFTRNQIMGVTLNTSGIKKMYVEHESGRLNLSRPLWLILSLSLWEKQYLDYRGRKRPDSVF